MHRMTRIVQCSKMMGTYQDCVNLPGIFSYKNMYCLVLFTTCFPLLLLSYPVSPTSIRSDAGVTSHIRSDADQDNATKALPSEEKNQFVVSTALDRQLLDCFLYCTRANDEKDVELEIFGPNYINVTDYNEFEQLLNCTTNCYKTATRGIGWQSIHGCDDNHVGDADGKCHKAGDSSNIDRALTAFIQKARECIECILELISYDYTDIESDLAEYFDSEEVSEFEKRTMKSPR